MPEARATVRATLAAMGALLSLFLLSAPLEVRVLEREVPTRVTLAGRKATCDGRALPTPVRLEPGVRELKVGAVSCEVVRVEDDVRVELPQVTRRYAGAVRATLEGGAVRLVNEVALEDYLAPVVHGEAGGSPRAALEAQAVVSRTFAATGLRRHARAGYALCDLTHCQLYRGRGESSPEAAAAVRATRGQVLLVGGVALKPAFFHASCGGHTSRAGDVFGEEAAGSAVSDVEGGAPRCAGDDFEWTFEVERAALARALGTRPVGTAVEPLRRDAAGRLLELRAFSTRLSGSEFLSRVGRALGWQAVRSMKFSTVETDTTVRFRGTGLGHGVGLCQRGARALAARGVDAKGILLRYFPESQVRAYPDVQ